MSTRALAGVLAMALVGPGARAQAPDAALKDRVATLLERLKATEADTAQAAESALVKLGPRVLTLLPEEGKGAPADRLARVRAALAEAADQTNLGASRVTLKGKGVRLSEVIQQLQAQTGNAISDLREREGGEAANPALDLDLAGVPFLEALDTVCKQAGATANFFTGDGSIGLMPAAPVEAANAAPARPTFLLYSGPFRILFKQISAVADLASGTTTANAQFEIAWEPRLRPMLLALKADELKIVDDADKPVEVQVGQESTDVVLRPENPVAELNLTLKAPPRTAKTLKSLKIKAEVTVPAGLKTFRFPSLDVKAPVTLKQGDVAVTLDGTEIDEQVWKVGVQLAYPGGGPAFESYRQGLFNNRVWLAKADGTKFEQNGGFSNTSSEEGKLGFEYLFVDAPGKPADFGLVYETPSKVLTVPVEFEFKDVPLP